jgi:hypothetical protein
MRREMGTGPNPVVAPANRLTKLLTMPEID